MVARVSFFSGVMPSVFSETVALVSLRRAKPHEKLAPSRRLSRTFCEEYGEKLFFRIGEI